MSSKFSIFSILLVVSVTFFIFTREEHLSAPGILIEEFVEAKLPELETLNNTSVTHRVAKGETWASIGNKYGFARGVPNKLDSAIRSLSDEGINSKLRVGQKIDFFLQENGLPKVVIPESLDLKVILEPQEHGNYLPSLKKLPKLERERVALGVIKTSFAASASEIGVSYDVVDELVDLFANRINFHRDFRVGDKYCIVYSDQVLENGKEVNTGPIIAARIDVDGEEYTAVRFVAEDGIERFFDASGELLENSFLRYPLKFTRISSLFSKSRFHPILKKRKPHNGVDFAAPTGTPVRSVADGEILFSGRKGPSGKMVKIKHSERYTTAYLHLSKIEKEIKKGAKVRRGQKIGAVGSTGRSTGPHLHYSLYDRGRYVDPMKAKLPVLKKLDRKYRIDSGYLERVLQTLDYYTKRL